jgi:hypothetical protein
MIAKAPAGAGEGGGGWWDVVVSFPKRVYMFSTVQIAVQTITFSLTVTARHLQAYGKC